MLGLLMALWMAAPDDPPLSDLERFPARQVAQDNLWFNLDYERHLQVRLSYETHHREELLEALAENDALYWTWALLRDAHDSSRPEAQRRALLRALHDRLGDEAYYTGRMPPFVPLHHFRPLD
jgi:hypothetical protein